MNCLTIIYNTINYSRHLCDYLNPGIVFDFDGTKYFYIGYYKPFNDIFIELSDAENTTANNFEYYNGTSWVPLPTEDETFGFNKSGFIFYQKPNDWKSITQDDETGYFIRVKKLDTESVKLKGINTIFANDSDLVERYPKIFDFLPPGATSFINFHQSARKDIIQLIRNSGRYKLSRTLGISDIYVWDLLQRDQLRVAGALWVLSQIFFNVSDSVEGKFYQLANDYQKAASKAVEVYVLSIDYADTGKDPKSLDSVNFGIIGYR